MIREKVPNEYITAVIWWERLSQSERNELADKYFPNFGFEENGKSVYLIWIWENNINPYIIRRKSDGECFTAWKMTTTYEGEISVWCHNWEGRHVVGYDCKIEDYTINAKKLAEELKALAIKKLHKNKDRPLSEAAIEAKAVIEVCNAFWAVLNGS